MSVYNFSGRPMPKYDNNINEGSADDFANIVLPSSLFSGKQHVLFVRGEEDNTQDNHLIIDTLLSPLACVVAALTFFFLVATDWGFLGFYLLTSI